MPNIGANSLAFMLDLNSTGFTKAFKDAQNSYKSFTQSLTDLNKNLNRKGQGFLDGMAGGANITVAAYKDALTKIQAYATANPIIQPVEFVVSQQSQAALNRAAQSAASGVGPVTSGGGSGGSPRASGGPRTRRPRQTLAQIAYAQAPGSSLSTAAADLQASVAQLLAGGPDMAALLAKTKSAQSALGGILPGNAGAARAMDSELARINRQILNVERDLLRTTREKNKLDTEERRRARAEARESAREDSRDSNRWMRATYGLSTLSGMLNSGVLSPLGMAGSMQTVSQMTAQYGGSRQQAYTNIAQTHLLAPGASSEEARQAAAAAMGVYGTNIGSAGGLLANLSRVGIGEAGGANLLTSGRMAGLSPEAAQLLAARIGLGARSRGITRLAGQASSALSSFMEDQSGFLIGKGKAYSERYMTEAQRVYLGMSAASGDTRGADVLLKLARAARDPRNTLGAPLGIRFGMDTGDIYRQLRRDPGNLQRLLAQNPEQLASLGISSQDLGALSRSIEKPIDLSGAGEAGSLTDANRQLADAASETRSIIESVNGSLSSLGAVLNRVLGDAPGAAGSAISTASNLATGVATSTLALRSLRGGAGAAAAGGGMMAGLGRWAGRLGRGLGRVLPGAAARAAARAAAGTAASSFLGPGAAVVGTGLALWGAYDIAKSGYDAISADNESGPLGDKRIATTEAMGSISMQLTTTNDLLAKILDAVSTSQVTSPQRTGPTTLPVVPRMPSGVK